MSDEWQPIETAPKNGTCVLLAHSEAVFDGWWEHGAWVDGVTNTFGDLMEYEPTHWMPLPKPPA